MDVVSVEHSSGMEAAEVHLPSAFAIKIPEPQVSLSFFVAMAYACTSICVKRRIVLKILALFLGSSYSNAETLNFDMGILEQTT